ncbi:hypothetical protein CPB84DRAFT_1786289 [Gymnopilus junonius]|uniref:Uncharacterized protein n=1 Tax=Gymnopilus junonius TaxID=109634 RepID=A0A9P5TKT5_GYMJU|nr:hypothetical protein CPB84DRAFT_1786289 [Gymnopilus junonius]
MDKSSSIIAAFEAGKLPSTQQFDHFIDYLNDVAITKVEPSSQTELSSQGRVLANDLRKVLDAYKYMAANKDADNALQEAIWHLSEGDLTVTSEAEADKEQALSDLKAIRTALRNVLSIFWHSLTSEGTSLGQEFLSVLRLSIADAAEVIETQAGSTKKSLRHMEEEVQEGKRDSLGRDKKRLEEEQDPKVAWQHGMDTIKDAGTSVIGTAQDTSSAVQEKTEKTTSRLQEAVYKVSDRAQSDPEYRHSLDKVFEILQTRFQSILDAAVDSNATLSSLVNDSTPEQHIPKALKLFRTILERLANTSLEPLIKQIRVCSNSILRDEDLRKWFDDFFAMARKTLTEPGFARSDEAKDKRKELRIRWRTLLEKDDNWKDGVDKVQMEFQKVMDGLEHDRDLKGASEEAQTGMQAAVEQATWFWQDLSKSTFHDIFPRCAMTEYKDADIEFVLENLDISTFNISLSHVDIQTSASPSTPSRTAVGTLTHVKIQALQLVLKDVSFWYKDKNASAISPSEFTGLMALKLPEKGVDVDIKIRLIPEHTKGPESREMKNHFNVIERAQVTISDELDLEVRESNHAVFATVFKPVMVSRLKEALEKVLSEQIRDLVDYADGVAWDVKKRRQVFEDTGLGGGGSLMAALWSEIGRLEREGGGVEFKATGTGVVIEKTLREGDEGEKKQQAALAMGAEPQILSGEKRGPLGTGSESLKKKMDRIVAQELGVSPEDIEAQMDVDVAASAGGVRATGRELAAELEEGAKDLAKEGKKQIDTFRRSVERKKGLEMGRDGWQSAAFDM